MTAAPLGHLPLPFPLSMQDGGGVGTAPVGALVAVNGGAWLGEFAGGATVPTGSVGSPVGAGALIGLGSGAGAGPSGLAEGVVDVGVGW